MRFPRRETLLAIAAVAAIPFSASAQSDSQAQTPANRALSTLGSSLSGPELPASQPATPQRLQLMHRYLTDAEVDRVMKFFAELHYSKLQAQVATSTKGLPANQQDLTLKAFKSAFDVAERRRESATLAGTDPSCGKRFLCKPILTNRVHAAPHERPRMAA